MDGSFFLGFIRDHLPVLIFIFFAAVLIGGWVVFESARGLLNRDEVEKLRRRVDDLEREQSRALHAGPHHITGDAVVLPTRWVNKGAAATTADGGCLLLLEEIRTDSKAILTIRVDGLPARLRQLTGAGEVIELEGKLGAYTIEVSGISPSGAQLTAWLRSRHQASLSAQVRM